MTYRKSYVKVSSPAMTRERCHGPQNYAMLSATPIGKRRMNKCTDPPGNRRKPASGRSMAKGPVQFRTIPRYPRFELQRARGPRYRRVPHLVLTWRVERIGELRANANHDDEPGPYRSCSTHLLNQSWARQFIYQCRGVLWFQLIPTQ